MNRSQIMKDDSGLKQLFEISYDPMWIIEANHFVECNSAAAKALGYASKEDLANTHLSLLSPHRQPDGQESTPKLERMMKLAHTRGQHRFEWVYLDTGGREIHAEVTLSSISVEKKSVILGIWRDITDRKRMDDQIRALAFHDQLTGLPNRRLLTDRLEQALASGRRNGLVGVLMLIDIDYLKPVNDTYGHTVGDQLLIDVARRLKGCVRETDTVARFGGDEFVIVLNCSNSNETEAVALSEVIAEKIRTSLAQTYQLTIKRRGKPATSLEYQCSASIGVTLFRHHDMAHVEILKRADTPMYEAKRAGRNTIRYVPSSLKSTANTGIGKPVPINFVQLVWRSTYECGIATIDERNRTLFSDVNTLFGHILSDAPTDESAALVDTLRINIEEHFGIEETLLASVGFPELDEHVAMHKRLIANAATLSEDLHAGHRVSGDVFQFLVHELVAQHLLNADRRYLPYLAPKHSYLAADK